MSPRSEQSRAIKQAILWALLILIFPISTGILSSVLNSTPLTTRLFQMGGILLAFMLGLQYIHQQGTPKKDWYLQPAKAKAFDYLFPLVAMFPCSIVVFSYRMVVYCLPRSCSSYRLA